MANLSFAQSKKILSKYNIFSCKEKLVNSKNEAFLFTSKVGFPVVLKIFSPDIPHITEIGGLRRGIENKKELEKAWDDLLKLAKKYKPKALIEGFLIQEEVSGVEIVIGMKRSREFGPVLMFGLGGVLVEVLKDVSFGIAPLSRLAATKMIKRVKGYKILKGFRGRPAVNLEKLIDILVNLSRLSLENQNIKEIDLNPIIVDSKKALIVDTYFLYEKK